MKSLIAVIVALLVIGGGWYWYTHMMAPASVADNTTPTNNGNGSDYTPPADSSGNAADGSSGGVGADVNAGVTTSSTPTTATITLTSSGFSPKSVTIKKGGTITWVNQSGQAMWIASAPHPTHTGYDGTTESQHCAAGYTGAAPFDECKGANSFSFTFSKVGSWNYHNHENSSTFGTVVVVE